MRALVACEYSGRVRSVSIDAREIDGFPGYLVASDGSVFGCKTNSGSRRYYRKLRPSKDAKGYLGLTLCGPEMTRKRVRVHRLVAECFIQNPELKPCVRHMDGNPSNNDVSNLSWGTYRDNENDKKRHGTYEARRSGKLSASDRTAARRMAERGMLHADIAQKFNVSRPTITRLVNGNTWSGM